MADALEALAARAAGEPFFLACPLAAYASSEGIDDARLAAALGCPAQELAMLRLCRAPRAEPGKFWDDVNEVAVRFGIDPNVLADAVRRGQVILRLREAWAGASRAGGSLLAARDTDAPPPEDPP